MYDDDDIMNTKTKRVISQSLKNFKYIYMYIGEVIMDWDTIVETSSALIAGQLGGGEDRQSGCSTALSTSPRR